MKLTITTTTETLNVDDVKEHVCKYELGELTVAYNDPEHEPETYTGVTLVEGFDK